jgi:peptide subunit release factor 1 (eRF1)
VTTFEVPPERLGRWLDRWVGANGPVIATHVHPDAVEFESELTTLIAEPPFPPLTEAGDRDGFDPAPLLEHAARDRRVGVMLVRLGAHAAGVFEGRKLVASKTARRQVHARHRAGGSSQRRFERRRGEQSRMSLDAAADVAARILLPEAADLEAVVFGGDRHAIDQLREDRRLAPLFALEAQRFLGDVPEPRRAILDAMPDRFRAVILRP